MENFKKHKRLEIASEIMKQFAISLSYDDFIINESKQLIDKDEILNHYVDLSFIIADKMLSKFDE